MTNDFTPPETTQAGALEVEGKAVEAEATAPEATAVENANNL
jgi:hypothetical protein